jgi:hypothetical protein
MLSKVTSDVTPEAVLLNRRFFHSAFHVVLILIVFWQEMQIVAIEANNTAIIAKANILV